MHSTREESPYPMSILDTVEPTDHKLLSKESSEMILAKRLVWFFSRDILNCKIIRNIKVQRTKLTSDTHMHNFKPMNSSRLRINLTFSLEKKKNTSLRDSKILTLRSTTNGDSTKNIKIFQGLKIDISQKDR